ARPHCGDTNARHKVAMLLREGDDIEVRRVVPPGAKRDGAKQQEDRSEAEQPAAKGAAASVLGGRRHRTLPIPRRMLEHLGIEILHHSSSANTPCAGFPSLR